LMLSPPALICRALVGVDRKAAIFLARLTLLSMSAGLFVCAASPTCNVPPIPTLNTAVSNSTFTRKYVYENNNLPSDATGLPACGCNCRRDLCSRCNSHRNALSLVGTSGGRRLPGKPNRSIYPVILPHRQGRQVFECRSNWRSTTRLPLSIRVASKNFGPDSRLLEHLILWPMSLVNSAGSLDLKS
jgi:hypothetical protein